MILVTGGQGFIGRAVCAMLMARGYEAIVVDTKAADANASTYAYTTEVCDIQSNEEINHLFRHYPITTVIHLASVLNTASRQQPFEATQVNIMGSLHLLEAARQSGVAKFIYGSSMNVYGGIETSAITDDELLSRPPAPETPYGIAKRTVEMLGMTYQQFGGNFVALRIAYVLGAGSRSTSSPWRSEIFEQLRPESTQPVEIHIPFSGKAQMPFVFIDDVAAMFVRLVEASQFSRQLYNTPAETWTIQALATYLESVAPHLQVTCGQAATGNPTTLTGQVFTREFGYTSEMSIQARIEQARNT
ncbi:MAG: NAD(P)-dependent oxidoreductase [Chloroflexota bacterium]